MRHKPTVPTTCTILYTRNNAQEKQNETEEAVRDGVVQMQYQVFVLVNRRRHGCLPHELPGGRGARDVSVTRKKTKHEAHASVLSVGTKTPANRSNPLYKRIQAAQQAKVLDVRESAHRSGPARSGQSRRSMLIHQLLSLSHQKYSFSNSRFI